MVPVEAMAAGCPVVALGHGGALETVVEAGESDSDTGVFFRAPEVASLADAINRLLERRRRGFYSVDVLRRRAEAFATPRFVTAIEQALAELGAHAEVSRAPEP